ncbi:hypothetical protein niasHT_012988 [Heterodera trifolii]|uniref:Uncharacterized protein n=1 Tax=Heterodera trifolii TaxID=157864 RepID=A0ABD2L3M2_9BILA
MYKMGIFIPPTTVDSMLLLNSNRSSTTFVAHKGHKWEMAEKNKGHNGPKSGQWPRKRSNEREMGAKGPQGTNAEEKQWAQKGHKWGKPEEEQRGGKWAQKGPREKPEEKQTKGEKAQKEAKSPRKGKGIWEPLRGVPN